MSLRTVLLLALAAITWIGASCGGDGESARPLGSEGSNGSSRDGSLLITRSEGLHQHGIESGEQTLLVPAAPANSFLLDPALSPSAAQIAYVVQPPPTIVEGRYDAGSDIWVADRDGSNARRVYEHETPNQLVRNPRWLNEEVLFAIIQEISFDEGITRAVYTLQRIDLATGQRTRLIDDALAFDISPDGTRIVYARLSPVTGETLHAVDIDGRGNPVELVPVTENLAPFNSPAYSPDGDRIAFASADQTLAPPPPSGRLASLAPLTFRDAQPGSTLDGLPQDIWVIDAGGGRARLVADLKEDIPALTWGGDGNFIYVLGVRALYELNLTNGAIAEIGEGVFHGQIVWAPPS